MDPLAHTLVGATLAQTRLRALSPLAGPALVIGANLPDVDGFAQLAGNDFALLVRRGATHGVLALAILPLLLAWALLFFDRWRARSDPERPRAAFGPLLLLCAIGTLTHPVLDYLNTYGIRLLAPFDQRWFYGDALYIVDPWVWLLGACAAVLATRRRASLASWGVLGAAATWVVVSRDDVPFVAKLAFCAGAAAIAALRATGVGRSAVPRAAAACAAVIAAYSLAMVGAGEAAERIAGRWLAERRVAGDVVMAGPIAANPFVRDVVVRDGDSYRFLRVKLVGTPRVEESRPPWPVGDVNDPAVVAALRAPHVRGFVRWMRLPVYEVIAHDGGVRVVIRDVRYARDERESGFGAAVVDLDAELRPR